MTEQIEHDKSSMVFDPDAVRRNYRADGAGEPPHQATLDTHQNDHLQPSASQHNPRIAADSPRPSSACPMPSPPLSLSPLRSS
ncbi:hypothetical protein ONZ45_g16595 [Pleurotus djamor]|nr:hypothetical protein ONZ45_g16595 [Pleurotus djamor]